MTSLQVGNTLYDYSNTILPGLIEKYKVNLISISKSVDDNDTYVTHISSKLNEYRDGKLNKLSNDLEDGLRKIQQDLRTLDVVEIKERASAGRRWEQGQASGVASPVENLVQHVNNSDYLLSKPEFITKALKPFDVERRRLLDCRSKIISIQQRVAELIAKMSVIQDGINALTPNVSRLKELNTDYLFTIYKVLKFNDATSSFVNDLNTTNYISALRVATTGTSTRGDAAVTYALEQLGEPYVFGANGPDQWDCSSLTKAAWEKAGIEIPRLSTSQVHSFPQVPWSEIQPGDIVYRAGSLGTPANPRHVGIYIGNGQVIHAPQSNDVVKIVPLQKPDGTYEFQGAVRPG